MENIEGRKMPDVSVQAQNTATVSVTGPSIPQTSTAVAPQKPPEAKTTIVQPPNAFSKALSVPTPLPCLSIDVSTIVGKRGEIADINVVLNGRWTGGLIKSAVKKIEREYRLIKHNMVRAVIRRKVDAAMKAEPKQKE